MESWILRAACLASFIVAGVLFAFNNGDDLAHGLVCMALGLALLVVTSVFYPVAPRTTTTVNRPV